MAGNGSTAFDDIVLRLGQQPRAANTAASFDLKESHYPERLHAALSQCQTKDEADRELRDDYEVHRRSADRNLDLYLDALRRVHAEERSSYIHEICPSKENTSTTAVALEMRDLNSNAPEMTREQWRLKVLCDSLSRDLLAMQETLELLDTRKPRKGEQSCSKWELFMPRFWFCVSLLNPVLWAMYLYKRAYGLLVYGDASCSLMKWKWPRPKRIESYQERVNLLYRLLHKGQLGERNRRDLAQCALDW
ncbi:hypothetical protein M440DRAFT_1403566 [Trichoderma longibrachiatum ATCC 18648]|uniref:Uncharacterized protein n=1 Tax=Trichoderma longibrachiatum ATCC 18648 TaxID=983965 RepID=A0A2T4BY07_TRILO|nr:hypothetical protein M440DRAFT_1403566 [Trichoderma longibrachiatum ATCC 18648]